MENYQTGTFRPLLEVVRNSGEVINCKCGHSFPATFTLLLREHWEQGHFDIPIYKEDGFEYVRQQNS